MLNRKLKSLDAGLYAGLSASYVLMFLERDVFTVSCDGRLEIFPDGLLVLTVDQNRLFLD